MSSSRLTPAVIDLRLDAVDKGGVPYSPLYDDVYHAEAGAWAQARHVFLAGNGLPQRWQVRERFTVLETGFGLGHNFLATWSAWRRDPQRCRHLFFVSVEKHPLTADDLARVHDLQGQGALRGAAHDAAQGASSGALTPADPDHPLLAAALHARWPQLTPGMHLLHWEGDDALVDAPPSGHGTGQGHAQPWRVSLLLCWGDVAQVLPQLLLRADAFYLDGFSPACNPDMWDPHQLSRLNRLAAPGATVATWSYARVMRDALTQAGFELSRGPGFGSKRDMCCGHFAPRHQPESPPGSLLPTPAAGHRRAIVVGAGLAGACTAYALCREGWEVTVVDRAWGPARGASGNPAGLFHSIVHGEDGIHTRAHRAAALATTRLLSDAPGGWPSDVAQVGGMLRLAPKEADEAAQQLLDKLGWPASHLGWLPADQASLAAGVPLSSGAWRFEQAGMVNPAAWTQALLDAARQWAKQHGRTLKLVWGVRASALTHDDQGWRVDGHTGQASLGPDWRAHADSVVLCNAQACQDLIHSLPPHQASVELPISSVRGQTTVLSAQALHDLQTRWGLPAPHRPRLPVAGNGYAISLPDGGLLLGATTQHHDRDPSVRDVDHRHNLLQAVQLGVLPAAWAEFAHGLPDAPTGHPLMGRTQWRATTPDRLPLVGALPWSPARLALAGVKRLDQVRLLPRNRHEQGGLFIVSGLGSRGITWAGLLVDMVAHWMAGAPCPIEADLRDAMDPARFLARLAKKGEPRT